MSKPALFDFTTSNPGALHQALTAATKVAKKADKEREALRFVNLTSTPSGNLVIQASDGYVLYRAELAGTLTADHADAPRGFLLPAHEVAATVLPQLAPAKARRAKHGGINISADHQVEVRAGECTAQLTLQDAMATTSFPSLSSLAAKITSYDETPTASYTVGKDSLALMVSLAEKSARFTLRSAPSHRSTYLTTEATLDQESAANAWSYTLSTLVRD